ncbi:hypothetical protein GOQ27_16865 [Clostridium sp. D2Q-11]|uniref:DUF8052 domain-containing protein n=1 Tax=Anaeromonas frigoriresistens TaxID=2683708 RepID=A0A942UW45_9FIRM|nr:hypothetical protein [Anaeromonas frigoriresistens]MBS4540153.1 hypothetical protein [Anaeromonas frigoriresistens]
MDFITYKNKMKDKYKVYFDIEKNSDIFNTFDMVAKSNIKNEKFFLTKKSVIYSYENNEVCLIKYTKEIDEVCLDEFICSIKENMDKATVQDENHMSTVFTGILVTDKNDNIQLHNKIKKFKYYQSYCLGLRGWSEIRLILITLRDGKVICSKKAKKIKSFYEP